MSIDAGDILRIVAKWSTNEGQVLNSVWHYNVASGAALIASDIIDAINANYITAFLNVDQHINNAYQIDEWDLLQWDAVLNRFDGVLTQAASGIVGTSVSSPVPPGVGMLGRVVTDSARRQGRHNIAGVSEGVTNTSELSAAAEADLALFMLQFDATLAPTGGSITWCTWNTDVTSPIFESFSPASGTAIANTLMGYQRTRKPGIGI